MNFLGVVIVRTLDEVRKITAVLEFIGKEYYAIVLLTRLIMQKVQFS
jgi:hypothetical protein